MPIKCDEDCECLVNEEDVMPQAGDSSIDCGKELIKIARLMALKYSPDISEDQRKEIYNDKTLVRTLMAEEDVPMSAREEVYTAAMVKCPNLRKKIAIQIDRGKIENCGEEEAETVRKAFARAKGLRFYGNGLKTMFVLGGKNAMKVAKEIAAFGMEATTPIQLITAAHCLLAKELKNVVLWPEQDVWGQLGTAEAYKVVLQARNTLTTYNPDIKVAVMPLIRQNGPAGWQDKAVKMYLESEDTECVAKEIVCEQNLLEHLEAMPRSKSEKFVDENGILTKEGVRKTIWYLKQIEAIPNEFNKEPKLEVHVKKPESYVAKVLRPSNDYRGARYSDCEKHRDRHEDEDKTGYRSHDSRRSPHKYKPYGREHRRYDRH
uniref:Alba domain-containing protein n=1 Tax=Panagrellus redivivus TaxID=6233 RepID=A0A7E4VHA5_PANRE